MDEHLRHVMARAQAQVFERHLERACACAPQAGPDHFQRHVAAPLTPFSIARAPPNSNTCFKAFEPGGLPGYSVATTLHRKPCERPATWTPISTSPARWSW